MTNNDQSAEDATELVMKKEGEYIHIWVVLEGEQIFHAAPHVQMAKMPVYGAIQTFLSRAFEHDLPKLKSDEEENSRGIFR